MYNKFINRWLDGDKNKIKKIINILFNVWNIA
jgi:hypothetical protein